MEFGKYLKRCRESNFITQEELVLSLYDFDKINFKNLDTVTLSRWERQATTPNTAKQLSIVKFFQSMSNKPLPCLEEYSANEIVNLMNSDVLYKIFGKTEQLVLNFPSNLMTLNDMKVYPINELSRVRPIFDINMELHLAITHPLMQIDPKKFELWALHPSALFLACEYKGRFVGFYFSLRLKEEVFDKLMTFKMKKNDITERDFAYDDEIGSNYLISFFSMNKKVASVLFLSHYAYLIANQSKIREIGITTALTEVKQIAKKMELSYFTKKELSDGLEVEAYRDKLSEILSREHVVKMLFS